MSLITDLMKGGIEGLLGAGGNIIDKFVTNPEQKLEAQKMLFEAEQKAARNNIEAEKNIHDFALKYEGTADQVPKWILVLRSMIRPVITICMFFSLMFFLGYDIYQLLHGHPEKMTMTVLPQAYWVIIGIVFGFWFGSKAGENIVDKLGNKKK